MVGIGRGDLTDTAWAKIAPLLLPAGRPRGRWGDHRTVINGILWKLHTGAPWQDLHAVVQSRLEEPCITLTLGRYKGS